jgi:hypothetical protein
MELVYWKSQCPRMPPRKEMTTLSQAPQMFTPANEHFDACGSSALSLALLALRCRNLPKLNQTSSG